VEEPVTRTTPLALDGLTIIDLSHFEAGPVATQALAFLGADVIKIERPGGPPDRLIPSFPTVNMNKRSMTLNLKSPDGLAVMMELLRRADILVDNFGPGVMERLGLHYDAVSQVNPRLICLQIQGFGSDSPYANYRSYDPIAQAMGGAMSITGRPDGPPMRSGVNIGDSSSGLYATIGVLAAVLQREHTGRGQRIEVALQDAVIALSRTAFVHQMLEGEATPRVGNEGFPSLSSAPSNAYHCAPFGPNDWCYIHVHPRSEDEWLRLLAAIGRADLVDDPRLGSSRLRFENVEFVDALLSEWTGQHTKNEVMTLLGEQQIGVGPVLSTDELTRDAYLLERGAMAAIDVPDRGRTVIPGWPVHMSASPVEFTAPHSAGADTTDVLRDLLGYDDDRIAGLRASGAV
jgi:formyl-CoA transferase